MAQLNQEENRMKSISPHLLLRPIQLEMKFITLDLELQEVLSRKLALVLCLWLWTCQIWKERVYLGPSHENTIENL